MASRILPGALGLNGDWDQGDPWKLGGDQNWLKLSVLTQPVILSITTPLPTTGTPADGYATVVPDGPQKNEIAVRDKGAWVYLTPKTGWRVIVEDTGRKVAEFDGTDWKMLATNGIQGIDAGSPNVHIDITNPDRPSISVDATSGGVTEVVAGSNIQVNNTDPKKPVVSANFPQSVKTIRSGSSNVNIDNTDPENPRISVTGGEGGQGIQSISAGSANVHIGNTDPNNPTISVDVPDNGVVAVQAGTNVTVDNTDPKRPKVNVTASSDGVQSVTRKAGSTNLIVDNADPKNPIISVAEYTAGTNVTIDKTNPMAPTINVTNSGGGGTGLPPYSHIGIAAMGDSLTQGGRTEKNGWLRMLCFLSGQRWRFRDEVAVGGVTAETMETDQLPQILAMKPLPQACVIAGGSNNLNNAAQVDTGIAAIKRMAAALEAKGIVPVLWTLPPRGDLPGTEAHCYRWNAAIHDFRRITSYPLVDANAAMQNPGSYAITPTAATTDGTHMTTLGNVLIARYALADDKFTKSTPESGPSLLATYNNDPTNLMTAGAPTHGVTGTKGLFMTGSATVAEGVQVAEDGKTTYSLALASAPAKGRVQIMSTATAQAAPIGNTTLATIDVVAGAKYEFMFRLKASSQGVANAWNALAAIYWANDSWGSAGYEFLLANTCDGVLEGVLLAEVVAPANAAMAQVLMNGLNTPTTGATSLEVSQFSVRRITDPT